MWVMVTGVSQKRCPDVFAGAGVESKDKSSSCLLRDGFREAISVWDLWEVRKSKAGCGAF